MSKEDQVQSKVYEFILARWIGWVKKIIFFRLKHLDRREKFIYFGWLFLVLSLLILNNGMWPFSKFSV